MHTHLNFLVVPDTLFIVVVRAVPGVAARIVEGACRCCGGKTPFLPQSNLARGAPHVDPACWPRRKVTQGVHALTVTHNRRIATNSVLTFFIAAGVVGGRDTYSRAQEASSLAVPAYLVLSPRHVLWQKFWQCILLACFVSRSFRGDTQAIHNIHAGRRTPPRPWRCQTGQVPRNGQLIEGNRTSTSILP